MYLKLNKKHPNDVHNFLECQSFFINYNLEEKEIFFENSSFYLFLKSNYSENYINKVLENVEETTFESIKKAFEKDGFFVVVFKETNHVLINRDVSGLCSAYYFIESNEITICTNVHILGKEKAKELDSDAVHQLLYFDFLWDGQTIYKNIFQFKLGANFKISKDFKIQKNNYNQPHLEEVENKFSDDQNIKMLRQEIVRAHKPYLNTENVVFLSGGIDSVAMLIALNDLTDKNHIVNHSFKVKGTTQDETEYAKSIASHLDNKLLIIERNFTGEIDEAVFRNEIKKMNNPYPGIWIFGNQVSNLRNRSYYAGQDTRLHTPSLNKLDIIAFNMFMISNNGFKPIFFVIDTLLYPLKKVFDLLLKNNILKSKIFLGLRRALYLFDTLSYINLVYFKVDKQTLASFKLPLQAFEKIKKSYNLTLKGVKNKRILYNTIVSKKWTEQYVNDMRYMVDMVNNQGGKLAMPFYDMDLAKFSATIPFELAIKTMKGKGQFSDKPQTINKYVLREALVDKIDQKTYLRSKAVSRTGHLFFNNEVSEVLKSIIKKDLKSSDSLIKKFNLMSFLNKFLENKDPWKMNDDKYLLKVYYTVCLIVYKEELRELN